MLAKLYLPLLLTVWCGGLLLTQAGGSKLYRKTSFWPRSEQTESLVVRKSGKNTDKSTQSHVDPESLCIKHTLLSLEDAKASKYGSMKGWMTQDDWGEEWRKINQSEFRFVKIGVDGFPCAAEGCCKHSMTLRLGGSDWFVVQHVINEYATFLKTLLPWQPKAILEGGGNIGVATSLFAFLYPEAKIIVLEPEPENCKLLKGNTKVFKNVVVECVGLWDREGASVQLHKAGDNQPWAWRLTEVPLGTQDAVKTTSVPALLKKYGLTKFDMAKIDIEGAEFNVFKPEADTQWVDDTQVMMLELHGSYGDPQSLRLDFTARGFNTEKSGEYDTFTRPAVQRLAHKRHVH